MMKSESRGKELGQTGSESRPRPFAWVFIISNCQRKQHIAYRQHRHTHTQTQTQTHTHPLGNTCSTIYSEQLGRLHKCNHLPAAWIQSAVLMMLVQCGPAQQTSDHGVTAGASGTRPGWYIRILFTHPPPPLCRCSSRLLNGRNTRRTVQSSTRGWNPLLG